jgi:hypothetical protein
MLKSRLILGLFLCGFLVSVTGAAASASSSASVTRFEGVGLGDTRAQVTAVAGKPLQGDKVSFSIGESEVEVTFSKGKVTRINLRYLKGALPIREFTDRFGKPVRRSENSSVLYVFTVDTAAVVTLERVTGFPGYYVDVVAP